MREHESSSLYDGEWAVCVEVLVATSDQSITSGNQYRDPEAAAISIPDTC